jgi:hypothetical protein
MKSIHTNENTKDMKPVLVIPKLVGKQNWEI